jgi:hypothetical protein
MNVCLTFKYYLSVHNMGRNPIELAANSVKHKLQKFDLPLKHIIIIIGI